MCKGPPQDNAQEAPVLVTSDENDEDATRPRGFNALVYELIFGDGIA